MTTSRADLPVVVDRAATVPLAAQISAQVRLAPARLAGAVDAQPGPGMARLLGDTAGMHVVLELPAGLPAERAVAAAASRGVALFTLDRFFAGPPALNGLIIGYGAAPLTQVRRAASELGPLLTRLLSRVLRGDRQCLDRGQRVGPG